MNETDVLARRPVLNDAALDTIFRTARTHNGFSPRPVEPALLRAVYDLAKMGPTSANSSPMRVIFVTSADAKKRLEPALSEGNRAKTMAAPVTAIIGYDTQFYDLLPKLFPHSPDVRSWFAGKPHAEETAFRNGTLQGGYLIIAARALGLDCGPMSGFDKETVNRAFFPDGRIKANFLCNLGYGNGENMFPRSPRLSFEEACSIE